MKKTKKIVIGNWKMNPVHLDEAKSIATAIKRGIINIKHTQVVICPPYVYLAPLSKSVSTTLLMGSQNAHNEPFGSFTGEVSFNQLHQFKTSFVIIGHSERRKMGDTDSMINKKVLSVTGEGMTAVLCVGETVRDTNGEYLEHIKQEIAVGLSGVSKKLLDHIVIAYEPVWAIGARDAMNPNDIHEMMIYVRKILKDMFGPLSQGMRVIYGGAVNEYNTKDIVKQSSVDGFLVGRESLKPKSFIEIIKLIDAEK